MFQEKKQELFQIPIGKEKTKTVWFRGDTILLSIGQGFTLVTPIQLAKAYTFLANKGWAYEPHVVSRIEDVQTGKTETVVTQKNCFN